MQPRHNISRSAIELTKRFEGYRRRAAQLPDGRWTIGYGHTRTARRGAEVSEDDAEALLTYDMISVAHAVNSWTFTPLTQNQFDALCAFTFNIGLDNFRTSAVLRRVNEGQLLKAACAMELWRKADFEGERIVIDALVRRRSAEKTLFLTPTKGWIPAPSPILRPNLDLDVSGVVPEQTPTALTAAMEGPHAVAARDEQAVAAPAPIEDEEGPTPTEAAAAAVSARLASLFPDPETAPEPEPTPTPTVEAAPPEVVVEDAPAAEEPWLLEPLKIAPLPANDLETPRAAPEPQSQPQPEPVSAAEETLVSPAYERLIVEEPRTLSVSVLAALAAGGLGLIALALILASHAQTNGVGPVASWLVGIAGIGLFAFAAYLLLDHLGHAGDELDN
jgi:lysozyme